MTEVGKTRLVLVLAVLAGGGLFLAAAASRHFDGPDEPRYALIAREMAERGDALVLTLDGKLYREKPPLWYWGAAAAGRLLGRFDDLSSRLPSVASGTLLLLVIGLMGGRLLGDLRTGALGAVLYALSVQGLSMGHRAYLDTTLTLFTTGAALVFLGGLERRRAGIRAYALGWLLLGLGLLTKGPPAFLPVLLALGAWAVARRDARALLRVAPHVGVPLALGVVALWLVPWAARVGWGEVGAIFTRQISGRAVDSHAHAKPIWFYLGSFPVQFLPWSLLIPTAIVAARGRRESWRGGRLALLLWLAGGVLVFSLFSGKRPLYLLPFYPAACLLAADHLRRADVLGAVGRVSAWIAALLPLVAAGVLVVILEGRSVVAFVLVAVAACATVLAIVRIRRGNAAGGALLAVATLLALALPAAPLLGRLSDERRSALALVAAAERHRRPEDVPVRYRTSNRSLPWYTGVRWRWAGGTEDLTWLRRRGPLLLAGEEEDLAEIPGLRRLEDADYDGEVWVVGRLD